MHTYSVATFKTLYVLFCNSANVWDLNPFLQQCVKEHTWLPLLCVAINTKRAGFQQVSCAWFQSWCVYVLIMCSSLVASRSRIETDIIHFNVVLLATFQYRLFLTKACIDVLVYTNLKQILFNTGHTGAHSLFQSFEWSTQWHPIPMADNVMFSL